MYKEVWHSACDQRTNPQQHQRLHLHHTFPLAQDTKASIMLDDSQRFPSMHSPDPISCAHVDTLGSSLTRTVWGLLARQRHRRRQKGPHKYQKPNRLILRQSYSLVARSLLRRLCLGHILIVHKAILFRHWRSAGTQFRIQCQT